MSEIAPPAPSPGGVLHRVLHGVAHGLAVAGGLITLFIALFVTISVLMRWTTGFGIRGDFELVQISTAVAIFAFMPLCQWQRGNIFVDTFTTWLPESISRFVDALWDLVYAGFAGLIGWRLLVGAFESRESGTNSMVLQLPQWPAILVAASLMMVLGLVAVATAWRMARTGR